MPQASERGEAAYQAYLAQTAAEKQQARAPGGELVDPDSTRSGQTREMTKVDLPPDVGISGKFPPARAESASPVKRLEANANFILALGRVEGGFANIREDINKGRMDKNTLGKALTKLHEQMQATEDIMRSEGASDKDVQDRMISHNEQYAEWYNQWEQMK